MIDDNQRLAACRRFQKGRMILPRRIQKLKQELRQAESDLGHYDLTWRGMKTFFVIPMMVGTTIPARRFALGFDAGLW
jgi:hypothetical protein